MSDDSEFTRAYDDLEAAVARGAAWLDERRPGWYLEIDPADLDLNDRGHCVLGQLGTAILAEHGVTDTIITGYDACRGQYGPRMMIEAARHVTCIRTALRLNDLTMNTFDASYLGFNLRDGGDHSDWVVLDDLWIRAIKDRVG